MKCGIYICSDRIIFLGNRKTTTELPIKETGLELSSLTVENLNAFNQLYSNQQRYYVHFDENDNRFIFFYTDEIDISDHFIYKFNEATTLYDCVIHHDGELDY